MAHALNRNANAEQRINLGALQRVDPYIDGIITSATQVALYKFVSSEWEKTETEGTLFVYERQGDPQYGFIILNRLSAKNLVEPVTKELDFQLQSPFLLYKTKEGHIFGIWFYEAKECERVTKTIQDLVIKTEEKMKKRGGGSNVNEASTKGGGGGGDLAILLAKAAAGAQGPETKVATSTPVTAAKGYAAAVAGKPAQKPQQQQGKSPKSKDSDKLMRLLNSAGSVGSGKSPHQQQQEKTPPSPPTMTNAINGNLAALVPLPESGVPGGPNNVAAFFAQAEQQQQQQHSAFSSPPQQQQQQQQQRGGIPQHHPGLIPHHPIPLMPHHPSMIPLMQFMPHQFAMINAHAAAAAAAAAMSQQQHQQPGLGVGGIPPLFGGIGAPRPLLPPPPPHMTMQQHEDHEEVINPLMARLMNNPNTHSLESLERKQRLESLSPAAGEPPAPASSSSQMPPLPASAKSAEELEQQMAEKGERSYAAAASSAGGRGVAPAAKKLGVKLHEEIDNDEEGKPKLISPMVFAQTPPSMVGAMGHKSDNLNKKMNRFNGNKMNGEIMLGHNDTEISPLTQNQMLQAFQHLLRTDPAFVGKLHQAYVESLNTKLH